MGGGKNVLDRGTTGSNDANLEVWLRGSTVDVAPLGLDQLLVTLSRKKKRKRKRKKHEGIRLSPYWF
jgi:hypothetical protein